MVGPTRRENQRKRSSKFRRKKKGFVLLAKLRELKEKGASVSKAIEQLQGEPQVPLEDMNQSDMHQPNTYSRPHGRYARYQGYQPPRGWKYFHQQRSDLDDVWLPNYDDDDDDDDYDGGGFDKWNNYVENNGQMWQYLQYSGHSDRSNTSCSSSYGNSYQQNPTAYDFDRRNSVNFRWCPPNNTNYCRDRGHSCYQTIQRVKNNRYYEKHPLKRTDYPTRRPSVGQYSETSATACTVSTKEATTQEANMAEIKETDIAKSNDTQSPSESSAVLDPCKPTTQETDTIKTPEFQKADLTDMDDPRSPLESSVDLCRTPTQETDICETREVTQKDTPQSPLETCSNEEFLSTVVNLVNFVDDNENKKEEAKTTDIFTKEEENSAAVRDFTVSSEVGIVEVPPCVGDDLTEVSMDIDSDAETVCLDDIFNQTNEISIEDLNTRSTFFDYNIIKENCCEIINNNFESTKRKTSENGNESNAKILKLSENSKTDTKVHETKTNIEYSDSNISSSINNNTNITNIKLEEKSQQIKYTQSSNIISDHVGNKINIKLNDKNPVNENRSANNYHDRFSVQQINRIPEKLTSCMKTTGATPNRDQSNNVVIYSNSHDSSSVEQSNTKPAKIISPGQATVINRDQLNHVVEKSSAGCNNKPVKITNRRKTTGTILKRDQSDDATQKQDTGNCHDSFITEQVNIEPLRKTADSPSNRDQSNDGVEKPDLSNFTGLKNIKPARITGRRNTICITPNRNLLNDIFKEFRSNSAGSPLRILDMFCNRRVTRGYTREVQSRRISLEDDMESPPSCTVPLSKSTKRHRPRVMRDSSSESEDSDGSCSFLLKTKHHSKKNDKIESNVEVSTSSHNTVHSKQTTSKKGNSASNQKSSKTKMCEMKKSRTEDENRVQRYLSTSNERTSVSSTIASLFGIESESSDDDDNYNKKRKRWTPKGDVPETGGSSVSLTKNPSPVKDSSKFPTKNPSLTKDTVPIKDSVALRISKYSILPNESKTDASSFKILPWDHQLRAACSSRKISRSLSVDPNKKESMESTKKKHSRRHSVTHKQEGEHKQRRTSEDTGKICKGHEKKKLSLASRHIKNSESANKVVEKTSGVNCEVEVGCGDQRKSSVNHKRSSISIMQLQTSVDQQHHGIVNKLCAPEFETTCNLLIEPPESKSAQPLDSKDRLHSATKLPTIIAIHPDTITQIINKNYNERNLNSNIVSLEIQEINQNDNKESSGHDIEILEQNDNRDDSNPDVEFIDQYPEIIDLCSDNENDTDENRAVEHLNSLMRKYKSKEVPSDEPITECVITTETNNSELEEHPIDAVNQRNVITVNIMNDASIAPFEIPIGQPVTISDFPNANVQNNVEVLSITNLATTIQTSNISVDPSTSTYHQQSSRTGQEPPSSVSQARVEHSSSIPNLDIAPDRNKTIELPVTICREQASNTNFSNIGVGSNTTTLSTDTVKAAQTKFFSEKSLEVSLLPSCNLNIETTRKTTNNKRNGVFQTSCESSRHVSTRVLELPAISADINMKNITSANINVQSTTTSTNSRNKVRPTIFPGKPSQVIQNNDVESIISAAVICKPNMQSAVLQTSGNSSDITISSVAGSNSTSYSRTKLPTLNSSGTHHVPATIPVPDVTITPITLPQADQMQSTQRNSSPLSTVPAIVVPRNAVFAVVNSLENRDGPAVANPNLVTSIPSKISNQSNADIDRLQTRERGFLAPNVQLLREVANQMASTSGSMQLPPQSSHNGSICNNVTIPSENAPTAVPSTSPDSQTRQLKIVSMSHFSNSFVMKILSLIDTKDVLMQLKEKYRQMGVGTDIFSSEFGSLEASVPNKSKYLAYCLIQYFGTHEIQKFDMKKVLHNMMRCMREKYHRSDIPVSDVLDALRTALYRYHEICFSNTGFLQQVYLALTNLWIERLKGSMTKEQLLQLSSQCAQYKLIYNRQIVEIQEQMLQTRQQIVQNEHETLQIQQQSQQLASQAQQRILHTQQRTPQIQRHAPTTQHRGQSGPTSAVPLAQPQLQPSLSRIPQISHQQLNRHPAEHCSANGLQNQSLAQLISWYQRQPPAYGTQQNNKISAQLNYHSQASVSSMLPNQLNQQVAQHNDVLRNLLAQKNQQTQLSPSLPSSVSMRESNNPSVNVNQESHQMLQSRSNLHLAQSNDLMQNLFAQKNQQTQSSSSFVNMRQGSNSSVNVQESRQMLQNPPNQRVAQQNELLHNLFAEQNQQTQSLPPSVSMRRASNPSLSVNQVSRQMLQNQPNQQLTQSNELLPNLLAQQNQKTRSLPSSVSMRRGSNANVNLNQESLQMLQNQQNQHLVQSSGLLPNVLAQKNQQASSVGMRRCSNPSVNVNQESRQILQNQHLVQSNDLLPNVLGQQNQQTSSVGMRRCSNLSANVNQESRQMLQNQPNQHLVQSNDLLPNVLVQQSQQASSVGMRRGSNPSGNVNQESQQILQNQPNQHLAQSNDLLQKLCAQQNQQTQSLPSSVSMRSGSNPSVNTNQASSAYVPPAAFPQTYNHHMQQLTQMSRIPANSDSTESSAFRQYPNDSFRIRLPLAKPYEAVTTERVSSSSEQAPISDDLQHIRSVADYVHAVIERELSPNGSSTNGQQKTTENEDARSELSEDDEVIDVDAWYDSAVQDTRICLNPEYFDGFDVLNVKIEDIETKQENETTAKENAEHEIANDQQNVNVQISENEEPPRVASADSGIAYSPSHIEHPEILSGERMCICSKKAELVCACKIAIYCSTDCQLRDWCNHSEQCLKYRKAN